MFRGDTCFLLPVTLWTCFALTLQTSFSGCLSKPPQLFLLSELHNKVCVLDFNTSQKSIEKHLYACQLDP